ncbi:MAG TPA: YoaK family protein [Mycobacterium sp.]|nr:YoaK family protein [Mycobacterium sp.]
MAVKTSTTLRFAVLLTLTNGFMDAYTYLIRGGVFANVQTGNVIFFAIDMRHRHFGSSLAHLWPILAFLAGVLLSSHIKSGRAEKVLSHPLRWTMGTQAAALAVIGFVPHTVPNSFVTIPISFLAAMQFTLFRSIGDLTYVAVATTGNLMRFVESGYSLFADKDSSARPGFRVYGTLICTFASGAVIGAFASEAWRVRAIWAPAVFLAITLVLFIIDEREGKEP